MQRIKWLAEYIFLSSLSTVVNLIPFRSLQTAACILYYALYPLFYSARKRVSGNIDYALKFDSPAERKAFIHRNLINTLRVMLEITQSRKLSSFAFYEKHFHPATTAEKRAVSDRHENGLIATEGHFGNWELPVAFFALNDAKIVFTQAHIRNPYVEAMVSRRRSRYHAVDMVYSDDATRLLRHLRKRHVIGLVADQNAGGDGLFVPFLGRLASTHAGPAVLAAISRSDLTFVTCIREEGKYRIRVFPLAYASEYDTIGDRDDIVRELTWRWVKKLEEEVLKFPDQYFWVHRRWKSSPKSETQVIAKVS